MSEIALDHDYCDYFDYKNDFYSHMEKCLEDNNQNFDHGASQAASGRKILIRIDGPLTDPEGLKEFINSAIINGATYEGLE